MCEYGSLSQPRQDTIDCLTLAGATYDPREEITSMEPEMTPMALAQAHPASRRSSRRASSEAPMKSKRHYVKHDYQDHYFDPHYDVFQAEHEREEGTRGGARGGVVEPFPSRLYTMLKQAESEGFEDVVSWQPHGRCFLIRDPEQFVDQIMPRYFKQSKLTSFKRQVNLYGFRRLTVGKDRGAYYHQLFLRGRPDLHKKIPRMRVKGNGCKPTSSPETEPIFYAFPFCYEKSARQTHSVPAQGENQAGGVATIVAEAGHSLLNSVLASTPGAGLRTGTSSIMEAEAFKTRPEKAHSAEAMPPLSISTEAKNISGLQTSATGLLSATMRVKSDHRRRPSSAVPIDYASLLQEDIKKALDVCADSHFDESWRQAQPLCDEASSVAAESCSSSTSNPDILRPLPAPPAFEKFKNFRPISASPGVEESCHCHRSKGDCANEDNVSHCVSKNEPSPLPSFCPAPELQPSPLPSFCPAPELPPSLPTLPQAASLNSQEEELLECNYALLQEQQVLRAVIQDPMEYPMKGFIQDPTEYHHDPFQDQIKDLIQVADPASPIGNFSADDIDYVLDWFRCQPPRASCSPRRRSAPSVTAALTMSSPDRVS